MVENELILKYKKEKDFKEIRLFGNNFSKDIQINLNL